MMFDLEEESQSSSRKALSRPVVLPFVEQPPQPRRKPRRQLTPTEAGGLPASFSGLRPASLPVPSPIRTSRDHIQTSSSLLPAVSAAPAAMIPGAVDKEEGGEQVDEDKLDDVEEENAEEEDLDSRDIEILKLVAANTPSHRGAWRKDGEAWNLFTRRQNGRRQDRENDIDENEEDAEDRWMISSSRRKANGNGRPVFTHHLAPLTPVLGSDGGFVPGSMPIDIRPLSRPPQSLSLASYQPQTLASAPGQSESQNPQTPRAASSAAIRKAAYAERDRERAMDPGALDFAVEDGDDDGAEEDQNVSEFDEEGVDGAGDLPISSGRKNALKILKARSKIPEAGMWRSLAD